MPSPLRSRTLRAASMLAAAVWFAGCGPNLKEPAAAAQKRKAAPAVAKASAELRFISFNIPNLHYVEDDWRFDSKLRYRLPTEFEIRDALTAIQQVGGNVVRIYTLSVRKPDDPPEVPRHVLGPGQFNEEAFMALDLVLKLAGELGIRVIIPFVDNWKHWGGVSEYAHFRGKPSTAFWSDEELIADFEKTISYVLTRRNTLTGKLYREDDTIFAWETGNELVNPYSWTERIAAHIKRLDPNHPLIDGIHANDIRDEALADPNIDIVSTHHYTPPDVMVEEIRENIRRAAGIKPYFVGEFGFIPTADIERVLDTVIEGEALGALIWSLRFHNRDGGFYWHFEKRGYEAYHWPGFDSGAHIDERNVVELMRQKAFEIQGREPPALPKPHPPRLLPIQSPAAISWQGSAGAASYLVERAPDASGPWQVVGREISDARFPYRPLFADSQIEVGASYYYRVRAQNRAGVSEPSNQVGPVMAARRFLIDELEDFSRMHSHQGKLSLVTDNPQLVKMDRSRVEGEYESALVYQVPGTIDQVRVYAFLPDAVEVPTFSRSHDGVKFEPLRMKQHDYFGGPHQPDAYHPVLLSASQLEAETSHLGINLSRRAQIGRVELYYLPGGS